MKKIALAILALVFGLGLALNAYAQTSTQGRDMNQDRSYQDQRNVTDNRRDMSDKDRDKMAEPMSQVKGSFRASDLIGAKVENRQGDDLGKISDLSVDPKTGHIEFAVLSHGGVLGIGDKYIAIPLNAFEARWDKDGKKLDTLVLNMSKDKLGQAPNFDKDHWPTRAESERTYRYFGQTPYWGTGKSTSTTKK